MKFNFTFPPLIINFTYSQDKRFYMIILFISDSTNKNEKCFGKNEIMKDF